MADLKRCAELPNELKLMIWKYMVPPRIVEVAEPFDPDTLPEDLRKSWVLNRKYPTMAHVCQETRKIALAKVNSAGIPVESDNLDPRWCWKSTEIIHFNNPKDFPEESNQATQEYQERLINLEMAPSLGLTVSFSADVLHPFLPFRQPSVPRMLIWDEFMSLNSCIVSLCTIPIRATNEQSRTRGLFGGGEEPAMLVNPFDDSLIERYKALWMDTNPTEDTDRAGISFFESVGTTLFASRTERWLSDIAIKCLEYRYIEHNFTVVPPGLCDMIRALTLHPDFRHFPEAQPFLQGFPVIDMRVMFRLCPPASS